ncbi:hypothetical protein VW29_13140 [Devosia limi DSM 17137]|uniref:Uncharacterized protein n=2 Tax=Devosia TaxID=46913 RepID=A0A0F5LNJ2_9HYPH|nr:hypothetical protein VW29_13140 [Devosia limi DSM 17137]
MEARLAKRGRDVVIVNARLTRGGSRNGTVKGRRSEEGRGEGRDAGVESVKVTKIFARHGFTSRSQVESAAVKRREINGLVGMMNGFYGECAGKTPDDEVLVPGTGQTHHGQ